MTVDDIKTIGIVGAGTMGSGIAQVAALSGYEVKVFDAANEALHRSEEMVKKNLAKGVEKGKLREETANTAFERICFTHNIRELIADVIIEAVVEKLDVKVDIFCQLEQQNNEKVILATNTSSIPISRIASKLKNPGRLVGMHFFNPAHIMKLVEVISGAATEDEVAKTIFDLSKKMKKTPILVKDSPGFVVNRVARHFYVEALKTLEEGVASHEDIDKLMESYGFRMGPFRLMDLIGVDTNFSVTQSMFEAFHYDSKFRPSRIQEQKVDAGHWGKKTGKGFYEHDS